MALQRVFVKIRDFIKFEGSLVEFLETKIKTPRKSPEKWTFLNLAFYYAPSLDTVERCLYYTDFVSTTGLEVYIGG